MITISKVLLTVAATGLTGGILFDYHGVGAGGLRIGQPGTATPAPLKVKRDPE